MLPSITFDDIVAFIDNIRFVRVFPYMSLMVYCASLFVCESVKKSNKYGDMTWIESLFMCFVGQFGGTTIASIVIGQPVRFLTSDKVVVALIMAWVTIFITPYDLGLRIFQIRIVRIICHFFQLLSMSFSVTSYGVDYVFKSDHPKAMVGLSMLIVTGTISGCGGSILLHYFNYLREDNQYQQEEYENGTNAVAPRHHKPMDLFKPTFPVRRAFFATLLYIYLLDPYLFIRGHSLFSPIYCHFATFIFVVITSILNAFKIDIFRMISVLFHKITFIPDMIPAFGRKWSFDDMQKKSKEL